MLNRPEQRNALNISVISELRQAVDRAATDERIRCVVLTGAGGVFCAGADLKELGTPVDQMAEHRGRGQLGALFTDLWSMGKPTIARVDGYCLAGGLGLAMACDIVVSTDRSTFGAPEVKVGLWPYMITVPLLRSLPPKRALKLMLTGELISAAEAERLGMLSDVVASEQLDECVNGYVRSFLRVSPQAVALGKTAFYAVVDHDPHGRLAELNTGLGLALTTTDAAEGLAAFRDRRSPAWVVDAGDSGGGPGA